MKGLKDDIKKSWKLFGVDREDLTYKEYVLKRDLEIAVSIDYWEKEKTEAFMKFFDECDKNEKIRKNEKFIEKIILK